MGAVSHWTGHTKSSCFRAWRLHASQQHSRVAGLRARHAALPLRAWRKLAQEGAKLRAVQVGTSLARPRPSSF